MFVFTNNIILQVNSCFYSSAAIQWFGVDIGGTLVKCVYFETQEDRVEEREHDRGGTGGGGEGGGEEGERGGGEGGTKKKTTATKFVYDVEGQGITECVSSMRKFLKSNLTYGSSGIRDERLEMKCVHIAGQVGTLHFIKFATSRMDGFFDMVTRNGLGMFPKVVCATGGGAFKFESDFNEVGHCWSTCTCKCTCTCMYFV